MSTLGYILVGLLMSGTPWQDPQPKIPAPAVLTAAEQGALAMARDISAKCKVYLEAAARHLKMAHDCLVKENADEMKTELQAYRQLLETCRMEVAKLPSAKRKDLKRHEITVRRDISALENMLALAGFDDRPPIEESIKGSKELRAALLGTFFGPEMFKKP